MKYSSIKNINAGGNPAYHATYTNNIIFVDKKYLLVIFRVSVMNLCSNDVDLC